MSEMKITPELQQESNIDCMDAMRENYGPEAMVDFCLLTAFKYIWKAKQGKGFKDSVSKAISYLQYIIDWI